MIYLDLIGITFQSGDVGPSEKTFLEDAFVSIVGSFFGFVGAYLLFMMEVKNEKNKQKNIDKQTIDRKFSYFESQLRRLVSSAEKQLEHLGKFVNDISDESVEMPLMGVVPERQFEHFASNFNNEDFFSVYSEKLGDVNSENFNKINSTAYYFYEQHKGLRVSLDDVIDEYKRLRSSYQDIIERTRKDAVAICESARREDKTTPVELLMSDFIAAFYDESLDKSSLWDVHTKFSRSFKESLFVNFRNSETAMSIVNPLSDAGKIFGSIQFTLRRLKLMLEGVDERYSASLIELKALSLVVTNAKEKS